MFKKYLMRFVFLPGLLFVLIYACGSQEKPVKNEVMSSSSASSAPSAMEQYEIQKKQFVEVIRNIPFKYKSSKLYLTNSDYEVDNGTIEAYLDSKFLPELKKLLMVLPEGKKIEVEGYASARGTEEPSKNFIGNIQLSKNRAQVVIDYLNKKLGADRDKLILKYFGSKSTLPGIDPRDDRNCRVTFTIVE